MRSIQGMRAPTLTVTAGTVFLLAYGSGPAAAASGLQQTKQASQDCSPLSRSVTTTFRGVSATVAPGPNGSVTWSATFKGQQLLQPSALGLTRADADFTSGLSLCRVSTPKRIEQQYCLSSGKITQVDATQMNRDFTFVGSNGERMILSVRVLDHGVAV